MENKLKLATLVIVNMAIINIKVAVSSSINTEIAAEYYAALANLEAAKAADTSLFIATNPRPPDPPSISSRAFIDFNSMNFSAYYGSANIAPLANGRCPGNGSNGCFIQDDMVVGIVQDSSNPGAHLHRAGSAPDRKMSYHADSSGIYIRSQDSKAFKLDSMDFFAPISASNPNSGPNDFWDILGFNTALNPGLDTGTGDCKDYTTCVASQQVRNGYSGSLNLYSDINSDDINDFDNISALWIHYHGYPQTPTDGKAFSMELDNIALSPVASVPISGTVWLFASGLGLLTLARRKTKLSRVGCASSTIFHARERNPLASR